LTFVIFFKIRNLNVNIKKVARVCSLTLVLWASVSLLYAQKKDSLRQPNNSALLIPEDTANFLDKFMISELEKVQYAKYSDDLKKITLQKLVENQKLANDKLQQKLRNEQLQTESDRRQVEADRVQLEAQRQQEIQAQKIKDLKIEELKQHEILQTRTRNFLYGGIALLALLGISLLWSNWQLKKRNQAINDLSVENIQKEQEKQQILARQNDTLETQVKERTTDLEHSLTELKATQAQLIQSEKLASLGELTAGIAHEIQNPLNFVNNFSELSVDLAKDLNDEIHKPTIDKEYIEELLTDLSANQEKINHHGKRASSIVKGMLEHSRASTGVPELTDVNALADEYLRLSYHGLRAKDKSFNADFKTHFEEHLPKIDIVPQDIGRVILNLINNAFYAVNEKAKAPQPPKGEPYVPTVIVSTHYVAPPLGEGGAQIFIKVEDNGMGMPESVKAKVFQPFFTTKPTGSGTGLGLSLAYDIVTKGHGGTLEVESTEGVGSVFTLQLPTLAH
jgi:signal transduction histidine kinase